MPLLSWGNARDCLQTHRIHHQVKYQRLNANTCIVAAILFSGHPYIGRHYRAPLIVYNVWVWSVFTCYWHATGWWYCDFKQSYLSNMYGCGDKHHLIYQLSLHYCCIVPAVRLMKKWRRNDRNWQHTLTRQPCNRN